MKLRSISYASIMLLLGITASTAIISCTGDTDGGSGADNALKADPFVDNGGAGAHLTLDIESDGNEVGIGEKVAFRVRATDAQGAPLQFVRILCNTEKGVAIVEPSSNGTSVEATNVNGYMSGFIGGIAPGSYLMECRAQNGFNLLDQKTVRVTGTVPAGFQGFPGAAGGTLGGGTTVDVTPDVNDGNGVRIIAVSVTDVSGSTGVSAGPLDIQQTGCQSVGSTTTNGGVTIVTPGACTIEPFVFNTYKLTLKNDTNENVFVNTVEVRVNGRTVVSAQGTPVEIGKAGGTATVQGILTTGTNCSTSKCYNTGGGISLPIAVGSRNHQFIVTGESEAGNSFEISRSAAIQFDFVNNCAAGTSPSSCTPS